MGCCQTREKVVKLKKSDAFALTHYDEKLYKEDVLGYISECEVSQDWAELIRFSVVNVAEVQERCFELLEHNMEDHKEKIVQAFMHLMPSILQSVKAIGDSQRKSALKLIKFIMKKAGSIENELKEKIFRCAIRFFICNDSELRVLAAETCHSIFANSFESQKLFYRMNGVSMFMHMILLSSHDQINLGVLLDYFHDLVIDKHGIVNPSLFKMIANIEVYHLLRELRKQKLSEKNSYRINRLINILFEVSLGR